MKTKRTSAPSVRKMLVTFGACALCLCLCACEMAANVQPTPTDTATAPPVTYNPEPLQTATPVPTPTPTPSPTVAPTVEPSSTPSMDNTPEVDTGVYDAYYNDVVFVGDSITQGLQIYVDYQRSLDNPVLGDARFLAAQSYHIHDVYNPDGAKMNYRGQSMPMPDCLAAMEAQRVFIMLGLNDWAATDVDNCIAKYKKAIEKIREVNPDIEIVVELCTPITQEGQTSHLHNEGMVAFNEALMALCDEMDISYVDVSTFLKDENGALKAEYSSDNYVHMNHAGLAIWVDALREHARSEYIAGNWVPDEPIEFVDPATKPTQEPTETGEPDESAQPTESPEPTDEPADEPTDEPTPSPDAPETTQPVEPQPSTDVEAELPSVEVEVEEDPETEAEPTPTPVG